MDGFMSLTFLKYLWVSEISLLAEIKDYQYKLTLIFESVQRHTLTRMLSQPRFFKDRIQEFEFDLLADSLDTHP